MFTTLSKQTIPGISFDPSKVTLEETPMGIDPSTAGFTGLDAAGFSNVIKQGDGYRFTRNLEGDQYQTRTATLNPDGTLSWKGSWQTKTKESPMEQFRNAALLAGAGIGGLGAIGVGPAAGLFGAGGEALSGMDLAADAVLGAGNNIATAGGALGSGGAIAGTTIPSFSQLPATATTSPPWPMPPGRLRSRLELLVSTRSRAISRLEPLKARPSATR